MPEELRAYAVRKALAEPAVWLRPDVVVEVRAQAVSASEVHSCLAGRSGGTDSRGVSLRFPAFVRLREDKSAEEATCEDELAQMAGVV